MHDANMCTKAKATIKECYKKYKSGDHKFKCTVGTLRVHLRKTVGDMYWFKATSLFKLFIKERQEKQAAQQAQDGTQFQSRSQSRDATKSELVRPKQESASISEHA